MITRILKFIFVFAYKQLDQKLTSQTYSELDDFCCLSVFWLPTRKKSYTFDLYVMCTFIHLIFVIFTIVIVSVLGSRNSKRRVLDSPLFHRNRVFDTRNCVDESLSLVVLWSSSMTRESLWMCSLSNARSADFRKNHPVTSRYRTWRHCATTTICRY